MIIKIINRCVFTVRHLKMIRNVPNFPQKGVLFRDITPILEDGRAFKSLVQLLIELVPPETTKLLAPESRGFLLASAMTQHLDVGLVIARKPGKLPAKLTQKNINLNTVQAPYIFTKILSNHRIRSPSLTMFSPRLGQLKLSKISAHRQMQI